MFIRKAKIDDINSICTLHQYAFNSDYFTSTFSQKMLINFYTMLLKNNDYNYIAIDDKNNPLGFIVAGYKTSATINLFIKKNVLSLSTILLKNPKFLFQKIKILVRRNSSDKFVSKAKLRLLAIGVKKDSENKGIGTHLIQYLDQDLLRNGENIYGLSVKKNNINAIKFYLKNNFKVEKEDKNSIYYIKEISAI